ncbi:hypothetical protein HPB50_021854 [Hyalomma asiaticum]|uniref:Uncharacterized protein n=1 Tax=Hyalomma asiaticum TaxID=266040 RepID=A0ACB7T8J4_HYAAI|nr:hypothetical protein HPB50_021854 [Hyalomma asiaticum]
MCMNAEDLELLADVVASSKRISTFHFTPQRTTSASTFLQAFSLRAFENFTLLNLVLHWGVNSDMVKAWFAISDATRRNTGLVARAAEFVCGARNERWCAQALEQIAWHPYLVEKIGEILFVSEERAALMVREAVDTLGDLHNFMRLTGVVRQRVTCSANEGARVYLDTLGDQCWRRVRRYLTFDDVREPPFPV